MVFISTPMQFRESPHKACPCLGSAWSSKVLEPHQCGTETAELTLQKQNEDSASAGKVWLSYWKGV